MSENKQYQFYVVLLNICLTFSMRSHLLNFHAEYSKHMYVYIDIIIDVISVKSDIKNDVIAHTLLLMGALSREDRKSSFVFVLSSSCRTA